MWLSIREFIIDFIKLLIVIVIILLLMIYVVSITQVVGNSMNHTMSNGDVLVLNKIKYRFTDIKRGDIISLEYDDTKYLIKRVIGLPGDTISIKNNTLYINGELYVENYLDEDLVFEEFKGTGNMELKLDRNLQEKRIFPAIDILKSGTRREEDLLNDREKEACWIIRRELGRNSNTETIVSFLQYMRSTSSNKDFVELIINNYGRK